VNDAAVAPKLHGQAAATKHGKHGLIFGQHLRLEALHTSLLSDVLQMLENDRRYPEAAMGAVGAKPAGSSQVDILQGHCVVEHIMFCGKDLGLRIYCNPSDMPRLIKGA
jgi:hypothetical protein